MSEKLWTELSPEERRDRRFERWLFPENINFSGPSTEKAYKERVTRFIKTIKLEEPDRVPVRLPAGFIPAYYCDSNLKGVMYDYELLKRVWMKFFTDFESDAFSGPGLVFPGKLLEIIDYRLYQWPGHGIGDDVPMYQCIESENMMPEEYDDFIKDPADYLLRTFLPRSAGAFASLKKLGPLTPNVGVPVSYISQFGDPEVRAAVQALLDAGREGMKWRTAVMEITITAKEHGMPTFYGGITGAPFDMIGDMLRGTKGILTDMFRRPDKLLEAMERLVPILVDEAKGMADISGCPIIFMPLHKGTGGFMSNKQFEVFYWLTLKKVMMGLINEGLVPMPFAEGDYTSRLEIIQDMPRGKVIWWFETMDMAKAKDILGDIACIAGNLPITLLYTGSPEDITEGCRRLIETCGEGGGYILTGSASMNRGNPENLRAMMEAAKKFGVYDR